MRRSSSSIDGRAGLTLNANYPSRTAHHHLIRFVENAIDPESPIFAQVIAPWSERKKAPPDGRGFEISERGYEFISFMKSSHSSPSMLLSSSSQPTAATI